MVVIKAEVVEVEAAVEVALPVGVVGYHGDWSSWWLILVVADGCGG